MAELHGGGTTRGSPELKKAFFALLTGDVDRLSAWYCVNLGFRISQSNTLPGGGKGTILSRPGAMLEVLQLPAAKPQTAWGLPGEPGSVHGILKIGFEVNDLDLMYSQACQRQLNVFFAPVQPPGNPLRTFGLKDPDGNIVQFFGT
jgi:hypothetical protein